jgi:tripartite-type tricarboxylate transporter receptor subunit TctC
MIINKNLAAAFAVCAGIIALPAQAADYPERTVDLVIPFPAGGGIDLLLRALAEGLSAQLKQSFVVSNRTGAGGAIGVTYVARSAPDGYTLLFAPALAYSVLPLMQSVGYTDKAFVPICQTFENQMALIVRPDSPLKSARDIVDVARASPEGATYAATAPGTITHLAAAAFADAAKIKLNHIPFRGDSDLMGQLIGGHVDFASTTLASAAAAGPAVRVIGIFAEKRNPALPDVPTVKEQGYDVAAGCKFGVEQPAYADLAKRLHQGNDYYADAATFTKRIEIDVAEKRQLLARLGLAK